MSWRMVNGKPIQISDSPTISSSGKLHWNVRDILYKDYPECVNQAGTAKAGFKAPAPGGSLPNSPGSQSDASAEHG